MRTPKPRKLRRLGRRDKSPWSSISQKAMVVMNWLKQDKLIERFTSIYRYDTGGVTRVQIGLTIMGRSFYLNIFRGSQIALANATDFSMEVLVTPDVTTKELLHEVRGCIEDAINGLKAEDEFIALANEEWGKSGCPDRLVHASFSDDKKGIDMYICSFGLSVPIQFTTSQRMWRERQNLKIPLLYVPRELLERITGVEIVKVLTLVKTSYITKHYPEHLDFRRIDMILKERRA